MGGNNGKDKTKTAAQIAAAQVAAARKAQEAERREAEQAARASQGAAKVPAGTGGKAKKASAADKAAVQVPVPLQNFPGYYRTARGGIRTGLPDPGGRRSSWISPTGPTKTDEKEDRADRRSLRALLLQHLGKLEEQDRADARERAAMASSERIAAMRAGPRIYSFTATMNGRGPAHYKVKYKYLDRGGSGSYGSSSSGGGDDGQGGVPYRSRFEPVIMKMLERLDSPAGGERGVPRQTSVPRRVSPAYDWMPVDTEKDPKGKAFVMDDFRGAMDKARTARFQGGYFDPAFSVKWISDHMNGLQPGDKGFDERYAVATKLWERARGQYDKMFGAYGSHAMRGQAEAQAAKDARKAVAAATAPDGQPADAAAVVAGSVNAAKDQAAEAAAAAAVTPPVAAPDDEKKKKGGPDGR